MLDLTNARLIAEADGSPGPVMSVTKLLRNRFLATAVDTARAIDGPAAMAESGTWGHYVWGNGRMAIPWLKIAGGTDEIQRNILAERVLGLPREPAGASNASQDAHQRHGGTP